MMAATHGKAALALERLMQCYWNAILPSYYNDIYKDALRTRCIALMSLLAAFD